MNLFINPNQRGFELPKGCKDLIDVIRQPELMQPCAKAKLEGFHAPDYPQRSGFGRIKVYIARLFTPAGRGRMLAIGCDEPRILIWLMYRGEAFNPRLCLTYTGLEQAKAVRTVFSEKAVLPILDSSV